MKKVLNICSYLLNIFFIAIFAIGYFNNPNSSKGKALSQEEKASYIQECIVEREKADIPLKIQKYEKVYGITIESLVLTNNVEPYTGYLVTIWDLDEKQNLSTQQWAANGYEDKYVRKQKTVYVEISDITMNQEGQVSWSDNWLAAYMNVRESE